MTPPFASFSIVCFEISPDYRGKGIATLIVKKICEDAKEEGYTFVEAYPAADGGYEGIAFTGPVRLYQKCGFEEFEQKGNILVMRKSLF